MTNDEFQDAMRAAALLAHVVDDEHDYTAALRALEHAEDVGYFTDPTTWMMQSADRKAGRELLRALITFKREAKVFLAAAGAKSGGAG